MSTAIRRKQMSERAKRMAANDPINRMLKVAMIGIGLGLIVAIARVAPDLPAVWADTAAWRVHHISLLSTEQERAEVAQSDEFRSVLDRIKQQATQAYSK